RHARVLWQSALEEKKWISLSPSAIAPSIAYRCEMDLSPGSWIEPVTALAGLILLLLAGPNNAIRNPSGSGACTRTGTRHRARGAEDGYGPARGQSMNSRRCNLRTLSGVAINRGGVDRATDPVPLGLRVRRFPLRLFTVSRFAGLLPPPDPA